MQKNNVHILAVDVANKIAAGEVVERPVSVVKELVENALDARATKITVEISGGGRTRIRVADDGTGMSRADALLAVQRHATSKVTTAKDIDAITTLGFRGEALPSIAAVSHFELHTCSRETGEASRITIDGGSQPDCIESSRSGGTTISVNNLFYCVPARAKFLKTTATEVSHIGRFMYSMALAWPRKGFSYSVDGSNHFDLPPQPGTIDVNIHPSKREVRFSHEFKVQSVISRGVINAVQKQSRAPSVSLARPHDNRQGIRDSSDDGDTRVRMPEKPRDPWLGTLSVDEWKQLYGRQPEQTENSAESTGTERTPLIQGRPLSAPGAAVHAPGGADAIRAIGQAGEAYIVAEIAGTRNGLVLVDQHAAHERVNYDLVIRALESEQAPQQALLMPETIHLTSARTAVIQEQVTALQAAGFGIEAFGVDTFKIDAVPAYLDDTDLEPLLAEIADEFLAHGSSSRVEDIRRRLALVLVCRGSVKFNQTLSQPEMQALLDQLLATETPWTCPHGRPTMIVLPYDELEKRFGRRT